MTATLATAGSLVAPGASAMQVFRGGSTTRLDDGPTALILRVRPRVPERPEPDGEPPPAATPAPSLEGLSARTLRLYNVNTRERLEATYWREGAYVAEARAVFDHFLRDWREDSVLPVAPGVLDILCAICRTAGTNGPVHVHSGYRTQATNDMLAERDAAVARHSLHIQAGRSTSTCPATTSPACASTLWRCGRAASDTSGSRLPACRQRAGADLVGLARRRPARPRGQVRCQISVAETA